jgi:hypothetical protein
MLIKRTFTLSILLSVIVIYHTRAQTFEYEEGYYLNNQEEKIDGYILYEGIRSQNEGIHFKSDLNSRSEFIGAGQVRFVEQKYGFDLFQYYDSIDSKYVLVSRISDGSIKLDQHQNKHGAVFTFTKDTLTYSVQKTKHSDKSWEHNRVKDIRYKGALNILMNDSREAKKEIPETRFGYRSLKKIVDLYNREMNPQFVSHKDKSKILFGAYLGIMNNQNYYHYYTRFDGKKSAYHLSPCFGVSAGINLSRRVRFRAGLGYAQTSAEFIDDRDPDGSVFSYDADIRFSFIEFPFKLDYFFIKKRFKAGISAGVTPGFVINRKFDITNTFLNETSDANYPLKNKFGTAIGLVLEYDRFYLQPTWIRGLGSDSSVNAILYYYAYEVVLGYWIL